MIIPFGRKYSVTARLDIGGFGAGSKVAVNAEPPFNMKVSKLMTLNAGWKDNRKLNYDQERGPGIISTAAVWTLGPLSILIAVLCAGTGFPSPAWHGTPTAAGKADS